MHNENTQDALACRRNKAGGAAVIEGVMMKCGDSYSLACRRPDKTISLTMDQYTSVRKKNKFFRIPLVRGIVNFVEMMILNFRVLNKSAEVMGLEEIEESKFEKWMREHLGRSILDIVMVVATVLGVALGVGLFMFLPTAATSGLSHLFGNLGWGRNIVEGVLKIGIFVLYMCLVSLMPDIRRTFEYHGAEHKSIACFESGRELTPAEAKHCTRFHPRCGTSFIFVILIISIILSSFVSWDNIYLRTVIRLLMLPLTVGLGFEFIMFAGKHDNLFVRILSAPGLWMQRITTREPDEGQLEIAITALKAVLPEDYPDFDPTPYLEKPPHDGACAGTTDALPADTAAEEPDDDGGQNA